MLLYAVAAVRVMRVEPGGDWFLRCADASGTVISWSDDVLDILYRVPDNWNVVDGARCHGLHDDVDIMAGDPRFNHGADDTTCAIVGRADGARFVLLMQINAAEAVLLPERLFRERSAFEQCVCVEVTSK
ncbi:hypothetical protein [Trinickia mobilis]|uniref:hypothetical protein n=1 Tax=Trinickia mobilis TaxID=2816356 RepID=UPI001A8E8A41|nr:hypothetical protein [Trinickia mobilis]